MLVNEKEMLYYHWDIIKCIFLYFIISYKIYIKGIFKKPSVDAVSWTRKSGSGSIMHWVHDAGVRCRRLLWQLRSCNETKTLIFTHSCIPTELRLCQQIVHYSNVSLYKFCLIPISISGRNWSSLFFSSAPRRLERGRKSW